MAKSKKTVQDETPSPPSSPAAPAPGPGAEASDPVKAADPLEHPQGAVDPEVMLAKLAMIEADTGQESDPRQVAALCAQAGWAASEYRAEVARSRVRVIAMRDAAGHPEAARARDAAQSALSKAQNARAAALAEHDQVIAARQADLASAESRFRETSAAHERLKRTAPLFLRRRATEARRDLAAATGRLDTLLARLRDETASRADAQKRLDAADAERAMLKDDAPPSVDAERRACIEALRDADERITRIKGELSGARAAAENARATMDEADAQLTGGL